MCMGTTQTRVYRDCHGHTAIPYHKKGGGTKLKDPRYSELLNGFLGAWVHGFTGSWGHGVMGS